MDVFNSRISLDEAATIVLGALRAELLNSRPAAVFHHLRLMRSRISALRAAFPENALHTVAIKANPVVGILREVVDAGAGLEAASIEEVHLALAAGCPAERIVFDSPAKTHGEIREALRLGVQLNVDNFDELERIAASQTGSESKSFVGLRVNPMVGAGTIAHTSVADVKSKFGVPLDANRQQIIAAFDKYQWLEALHVHVGSQGCSLGQMVEAASRIAALRQRIMEETRSRVFQVDIGGGL
jgi:diaminopimelate decarboxylase